MEDKNINQHKKNYYNEFVKQYKEIRKKEKDKPKLLLHVCCAPCAAYPLIFLHDLFDITILYTNSNIYPKEEFDKRLYYLRKYVSDLNNEFKSHIDVIVDKYDYDNFKKDLVCFKNDKEMGNRCKICVAKRMNRLFECAKENDFKYVSSVMTISRNKDANYINELGEKLTKYKYKDDDITFIYSDFKKNNGQDIGVQIAKKYNMYRQNYCGCEYSIPKNYYNYEISVIVPIHGVSEYLTACLDSLKNQDITVPYEVVCVLDAPTKEDKEIAYKFQKLRPDIFKVFEVNFKEVSEVRNYGIMHSYSRYIAFVDGDDYVSVNYLSSFYNKAIITNADLIQSNYYITKEGRDSHFLVENPLIFKPKNGAQFDRSLCRDYHVRGYLWNKFFKREIIENNSIFFLSFKACVEDVFFIFVYGLYCKKVEFINDFIYHYVQRPGSLVHSSTLGMVQKMINSLFLSKYYAFNEGKKENTKVNFAFRRLIFYYMGISSIKYLEISIFQYFKLVNKQLKKLAKNTYRYEGDEWEKAIALYLEKRQNDYYKNKGKD